MEVVVIVVVVRLLVAVAMWSIGTASVGRTRPDDSPDPEQVTDDAVHPPAYPDRPVPGSAAHRERTRKATADARARSRRRRT